MSKWIVAAMVALLVSLSPLLVPSDCRGQAGVWKFIDLGVSCGALAPQDINAYLALPNATRLQGIQVYASGANEWMWDTAGCDWIILNSVLSATTGNACTYDVYLPGTGGTYRYAYVGDVVGSGGTGWKFRWFETAGNPAVTGPF